MRMVLKAYVAALDSVLLYEVCDIRMHCSFTDGYPRRKFLMSSHGMIG